MNLDLFLNTILISSLPGAIGGIAAFLFALKKGHYKNNQYKTKLALEILGGLILATFIGPLFPEPIRIQMFAAFAIGLTWAGIIQVTRSKITKIVKAVIGEEIS